MTEYTFHTLSSRNALGLLYDGEKPDTEPGYWTRREDIPDWMTPGVAQKILDTIYELKRAALDVDTRAIVYIPESYVRLRDRWRYLGDAQLFGLPLRLNEYTSEPQVALVVRGKRSK